MEEKIMYSMESPFQQEINVKGYYFGKNEGKERSACIVGALRGNEYQQLYICSKLIDVLKKIENGRQKVLMAQLILPLTFRNRKKTRKQLRQLKMQNRAVIQNVRFVWKTKVMQVV